MREESVETDALKLVGLEAMIKILSRRSGQLIKTIAAASEDDLHLSILHTNIIRLLKFKLLQKNA